MTPTKLNLAGRLAQSFVTSRLTAILIVGMLLLGVFAIVQTPREENPQILVPGAMVTVTLPGASAQEVERLVVTPLEALLSQMTGVDHTAGSAQDSLGMVQVQFEVGQPKEEALVRIYDRIIASQSVLPSDAGTPIVTSVDADDVPIVTVTLASAQYDDYALKRIVDRMAERLQSVKNVSVISLKGGRDREIGIAFDPARLQAFGITISQAYSAVQASNLSAPLGSTVRDGHVEDIALSAQFTSADDIKNQILATSGGRPIYVGDVATVTDGPPSEISKFSRFSFNPADKRFATAPNDMAAVTVAIAKARGSNAVKVADAVIERVERIRASFVPDGVDVIVTRNDGQKADEAVNLLLEHLLIALGTVALVLLVFLGWREALIVTITVPLIFSITLLADYLLGITINRVTLFGLILSLGLLVDAAIVVIENIHRHYATPNAKLAKDEITVLATNEIGNATNLATLAIMLVFLSLLTVSGMAGDFFYPVAVTVPVAMAASIFVAYTVTPWGANRWLHRHKTTDDVDAGNAEKKTQKAGLLERSYLRLITPLLSRRSWQIGLLALIVVAFIGSGMQGAWQFVRPSGVGGPVAWFGVPIGFLPKDNKNTFNVVFWMPEDSPVEETDRLVRDVGHLLAQDKNVLNYQSWVGQAGIADFNGLFQGTTARVGNSVAEIRVNLVDKNDRDTSSIEIVRTLRPKIDKLRENYPGARVSLVEDPPGIPVRATVLAELYGPDSEGLRALSEKVLKEFEATYDVVDLTDTEPVDVSENRIVPDKEKAALSGVSVYQIYQVLDLVYGGTEPGRVHLEGETNPVAVRAFVPRRYDVDPTRLDGLFVGNAYGDPVPLAELVRVVPANANRVIQHRDNEKVTFVGGELSDSVPMYAVLDLQKRLDGMIAPDGRPLRIGNLGVNSEEPDVIDGYQLLWGGEMRLTIDIYRDMGIALGGALLFVYLLLVAYYRSFQIPLIAMSAVPLGLIGIFPGHWLLGADFSATSMVGIIALAGVVVRNSLLIIDFIRDNQKAGMPLDVAVRQAGAIRLRPILLTMLAIIFGSAIMVSDPVFGGLAISLIFGTLVSTTLAVFVVPIFYYGFARNNPQEAADFHADEPALVAI